MIYPIFDVEGMPLGSLEMEGDPTPVLILRADDDKRRVFIYRTYDHIFGEYENVFGYFEVAWSWARLADIKL